ncbi:MAG: isochorismatase family protein [Candidatus Bathyarchaeia archaeon]|jgi:nicotinamidase/pyrazinamidase
MGRIVFWDVDTQVDFIEPLGKLPVPEATAIRDNLKRLTSSAPNFCILSGSVDAHTPRDHEFKTWPEHCVYGTPGQRKVLESSTQDILFIPSVKLTSKQLSEVMAYSKQILFEKQHNTVETNPNCRSFLTKIDPEEVVVYGVATDVCVDITVKYLADKLGFKVTVALDAIRGIDSRRTKECIEEWRSLKVNLQDTAHILEKLQRDNLRPEGTG